MNSKQEAKLNMFDAVLTHCQTNAAIVATVPAFDAAVNDFENVVDDLQEAAQAEILIITGHAASKTEQKEELISITLDVAGALVAFASANNNTVLKEQANLTYSDLNRLKDELLAPACNNIHDLADANAAALVPFGVTAAKITSLDNAITAYETAVPAPRNAVANRMSVAETIKLKLKEGDEILKERMDKLVIQFKTTEPEFHAAYKANREIIDPGTSTTKLQGVVTDSSNGDPLNNVAVQVVGQPFITSTNTVGEYSLNVPVPGIYQVQFTKTDYETKTIDNVDINLGDTTELNTTLVPVPA